MVGDPGGEYSRPGTNALLVLSSAEEKLPKPKSSLPAFAVSPDDCGGGPSPKEEGCAFADGSAPKALVLDDFDCSAEETVTRAAFALTPFCPNPLPVPNALVPPLPKADAASDAGLAGSVGFADCPNAEDPKAKPVFATAGIFPKAPKPRPVEDMDADPKAEVAVEFEP